MSMSMNMSMATTLANTKSDEITSLMDKFQRWLEKLKKSGTWNVVSFIVSLIVLILIMVLLSNDVFAALGGGGFESKVKGLQDKFLNVILPIMAVFGLGYAGMLAATGNEGAKGKIVLCLIGSAVAFLAPYIIAFVQSAVGH